MQTSIRDARFSDQLTLIRLVAENQLNLWDINWRRFIVIVDESDRVLGCGQIRRHGDLQELSSLVVRNGYRGQGLSDRLMEALLERSQRPLWLMCESRLVPFYQGWRFAEVTEVAELPRYFRNAVTASRLAFGWLSAIRGTRVAVMVRED